MKSSYYKSSCFHTYCVFSEALAAVVIGEVNACASVNTRHRETVVNVRLTVEPEKACWTQTTVAIQTILEENVLTKIKDKKVNESEKTR